MRATLPTNNAGTFTYVRHDIGWAGLTFGTVLAGPAVEADAPQASQSVARVGGGILLGASVRNAGRRTLRLLVLRWTSDRAKHWAPAALRFPKSLEPFYCASENFRGDYFGTATTRGDHFCLPMPHQVVTIGHTEDAYFPGLFVGSAVKPLGLFCAVTACRRLHTRFRLHGGDGENTWNFEIEQVPQGLASMELKPGETLDAEPMFLAVVETNDPQCAGDGYARVLRRLGVRARRQNPLLRHHIWGSWNFGPMQAVTEDYIVRQLEPLRERFPSVRFVQIDDGYERAYPGGQRAQVDLLYGGGDAYDREKFPGGPRELVRRIRAAGLRPATWLGMWASGTSPMIQDHPDWVLRDDMGRRVAFDTMFAADRGGPFDICVLDPSVPDVRAYIEHVARTIGQTWGFDGLKLDFNSFAFQIRRARYRYPRRTAAEYHEWMIRTFRRCLPRDGWLGLCCVGGTGSPFRGEADYFRYAEDIGGGSWEMAKRIALWTVNTNLLFGDWAMRPNVDGIGWCPAFDEEAWRSYLALSAISGGALEISGDLARLPRERDALLNRCLVLSRPGRRLRCLDLPPGQVEAPPSLWVSSRGRDVQLAAIFNWDDQPCRVDTRRLDAACPGWRRSMRPVWESTARVRRGGVELPARGSLLLERT